VKPAWSWQFDPETLESAPQMDLVSPLTREWAWDGSTGGGVRVGVIDSGIDADHPQVGSVAGGVALHWDEEAGEARGVEGPHEDLFGHGTACAALIRRVAPDAEIYSIRVLGSKLSGKGVVFAAGLKWAIDNGMQVVNMSLSTPRKEYFGLFHELVDEAYFHHMMLVCAVNNVPEPSYPSQYSSVFSVAAHDRKDPLGFDYNPSPPVEFGAPGIDVELAWLDKGTTVATGNSFAAAHLSGVIAKILGKHPGLTPPQMKAVLQAIADNA